MPKFIGDIEVLFTHHDDGFAGVVACTEIHDPAAVSQKDIHFPQ